jgi:hypothetical protein
MLRFANSGWQVGYQACLPGQLDNASCHQDRTEGRRSKDRPVQNCAPGQSIRRARSTCCVVRCAVEGRTSTGSEAFTSVGPSQWSALFGRRVICRVPRTSNVQVHNADLRRRRLAVERLPSIRTTLYWQGKSVVDASGAWEQSGLMGRSSEGLSKNDRQLSLLMHSGVKTLS